MGGGLCRHQACAAAGAVERRVRPAGRGHPASAGARSRAYGRMMACGLSAPHRADLNRADLNRADLNRADLNRADLARADLARADLARADLARADLARRLDR